MRKFTLHPLRTRLAALVAAVAVLVAAPAVSAAALAGPARAAIEKFIQGQTSVAQGKLTITADAPTTGPLPACAVLEPFLPTGVAPWGRFSLGIRCAGERPWTRFIAVQVAVQGSYLVAAGPIEAGRTLGVPDFTERIGNLAALPRSGITDAAQLEGMVAVNRIAAGVALRTEMFRGMVVIQQGQTVRLVAQGEGFLASSEGKAMTRAAVGATLQVKTAAGRLVSGVARQDGQVSLAQ
jgi:flagella basal body P-ring formation protein FlgA